MHAVDMVVRVVVGRACDGSRAAGDAADAMAKLLGHQQAISDHSGLKSR